jgi:hypothetical protein
VNRFYQNHLKDQILKMVEITVANSKDFVACAARIVKLVLNGTAPHLLVFDGRSAEEE